MTTWTIFISGSVLLTIVIAGGVLLPRRKNISDLGVWAAVQDVFLLVFLVWLASLSILGYIAFAFGKR